MQRNNSVRQANSKKVINYHDGNSSQHQTEDEELKHDSSYEFLTDSRNTASQSRMSHLIGKSGSSEHELYFDEKDVKKKKRDNFLT